MIEKKLIHFSEERSYQEHKDLIKESSITWVSESKKIITHGTEYQYINWDILEDKESLITFYIDGSKYEAVEGMTWDDWINSDYNSIGLFYITDTVLEKNNVVMYGNIEQKITMQIVNNRSYYVDRHTTEI